MVLLKDDCIHRGYEYNIQEGGRGPSHEGRGGVILNKKQQKLGGIRTTASSSRGVQFKNNVDSNKNYKVVIVWEVLRHSLGD